MIIRTVRHYVDGRLFEWGAAIAMLGLGGEIFIWPETIASSAFHSLVLPPIVLAVCFLAFGGTRAIALAVNGRSSVYGPRLRAYCALAACVIWALMMTALLTNGNAVPSPGIPVYFALACCELYTSYRAATDVRKSV